MESVEKKLEGWNRASVAGGERLGLAAVRVIKCA